MSLQACATFRNATSLLNGSSQSLHLETVRGYYYCQQQTYNAIKDTPTRDQFETT